MAEIRTGAIGEEHALTSLAAGSPLASQPEPDDGDGADGGDDQEDDAA